MARNIEEVKSYEGIDILWNEESHNLSESTWDILEPTVRKDHSEIWLIFNPRLATDFVYTKFVKNPPHNAVVRKINYDENPFTLPYYVNKWIPIRVSDKADGSLILFFEVNGKLYAKTKFNSTSDQSVLAMKIVNENLELKQEIHTAVKNGYTPMFELIHPDDPHVISYDKKHLYYLMSRNRDNGEYYFHDNLAKYDTVEVFDHKKENVIDNIVNGLSDISIKDKEGFVVYQNF